MILMLAPTGNMTFGGAPSGSTYVSDQFALIKITNDSVADQTFLADAGCFTLTPFGNWGTFAFATLADLYSADSGAVLPGITGFPTHTMAAVMGDGVNFGLWYKSSDGNGDGHWTQASNDLDASIVASQAYASALAAATSADEALAAAVSKGVKDIKYTPAGFDGTSVNTVPLGVVGINITAGGSGGTTGTGYAGGTTGTPPPGFAWTYDIAGGAAVNPVIVNKGETNSIGSFTLTLPNGGLAGSPAATATTGSAIKDNDTYLTPAASLGYLAMWKKGVGSTVPAKVFEKDGTTQVMSALKDAIDRVLVVYPTIGEWLEVIVDSTGRIVAGRKFDGTTWETRAGATVQVFAPQVVGGTPTLPTLTISGALIAPGVDTEYPTIANWASITCDNTGRIVSGMMKDGSTWATQNGALVQTSGVSTGAAHSFAYDYTTGLAVPTDALTDYLVMINGQSWALGAVPAGQTGDGTVTTAAQWPGNALMFDQGAIPSGAAVAGYIDLHEQNYHGSYETACSGMADFIMSAVNTQLGAAYLPRMIFAVAALGGNAYWDNRDSTYGLKPGSNTYAESVRLVQRAYDISKAAGRKLVVISQCVIHGEQDFSNSTPKALYQRALDQWRAHFEEDVKRITGQSEPVRQYVSQVQRGGSTAGSPALPALAALAAEARNPLIRCVGPVYQAPGGTDGAHLLARGYRQIGRIFGKFIIDDLFGPYAQPLRVIAAWWVSSTVFRLQYSKPITIDDGSHVDATGLTAGVGVDFTDGTGSPPTVSSATVTGTDTLEVTLSSAPTGKRPQVFIAALRPSGTGSGSGIGGYAGGARSLIRSTTSFDTDALTSVTSYHWACQEQIALPTT